MINGRKKQVLLLLVVLWLCVIFGHSLMPASISGKESGGIFAWLHQFFPWMSHKLLRKLAHFAAFAVLGGLLCGLFWCYDRFHLFKPMGTSLCAAFVDETIQLFVTGRSGQISDMWIDLSGAVSMIVLLWLLLRRKRNRN